MSEYKGQERRQRGRRETDKDTIENIIISIEHLTTQEIRERDTDKEEFQKLISKLNNIYRELYHNNETEQTQAEQETEETAKNK